MDRIILEVEDQAAKKWKYASSDKKEYLSKSIVQLINQTLTNNDDDFWEFVNKLSTKAKANGLTKEELDRLLNE